jgi:H+/Cl- antiporter ClcA
MLNVQPRFPPLIRKWYKSRLAVVLESMVIGFLTGMAVVCFRYLLGRSDDLRRRIYGVLPRLPVYWTLLWVFALVLIGLFLGWAAKARPMIRGSGIPQVKGSLLRLMSLDWMPELPLKLLTGVLGLGAGLSLGREGPSIQVGAYTGKAVLTMFRRPHRERKILVIAASAAGVAAAFNAPLAGVLFVLEELQAGFSPLFIACSMGAAMAADVTAGYFFGLRPVFDFRHITMLPLRAFPWIVLLGVFCGLLGDFFKRTLYVSQDLYERCRIPWVFRPVIALLVSVPLGFFLFDITGGGHSLIESLSVQSRSLALVALLLAGKILFTALCYGSGTSGGIFLPLLACGALTGHALGLILFRTGFIPEERMLNFTILGMAAFFTGVVNAPVTGIVLILEMSGSFAHLVSLVLVCLSAFVTSTVIASRPVYEVLLERIVRVRQKSPSAASGLSGAGTE